MIHVICRKKSCPTIFCFSPLTMNLIQIGTCRQVYMWTHVYAQINPPGTSRQVNEIQYVPFIGVEDRAVSRSLMLNQYRVQLWSNSESYTALHSPLLYPSAHLWCIHISGILECTVNFIWKEGLKTTLLSYFRHLGTYAFHLLNSEIRIRNLKGKSKYS